jgi:hypothetical protein
MKHMVEKTTTMAMKKTFDGNSPLRQGVEKSF